MSFLAGGARLEITPEPGVELMGYGARTGRATGVHDPLVTRALYLGPEAEAPAGILLASADLCLMTPGQARWGFYLAPAGCPLIMGMGTRE